MLTDSKATEQVKVDGDIGQKQTATVFEADSMSQPVKPHSFVDCGIGVDRLPGRPPDLGANICMRSLVEDQLTTRMSSNPRTAVHWSVEHSIQEDLEATDPASPHGQASTFVLCLIGIWKRKHIRSFLGSYNARLSQRSQTTDPAEKLRYPGLK